MPPPSTVLLGIADPAALRRLVRIADSDPTRLIALAAGVLVGAQMGAAMAARVSGSGLMRMLAVALVTVGARLIIGTIR